MKSKHNPLRTCVACRRRRQKHELLRFRVDGADSGGNPGEGRGFYICRETACMKKAVTRTDIRTRLGASAYARVLEVLETVTTFENCLDGSSLGSVICDECHGGGAIG